ncbi:MAG: J domain-containing protein [Pseudomonadota bacterium]
MADRARYKPKFGYDIRIKPPREDEAKKVEARLCEWPGCGRPGIHKAPKSREQIREYRWFCIDHVREYNKSWNFFQGMEDEDIATFQEEARTGHRPTWSMGRAERNNTQSKGRPAWFEFDELTSDPFELLKETASARKVRPPRRRLTAIQEEAFATFNLETSSSSEQIKARYKELVKKFHPDANPGKKGYEDRLKRIIDAYQHLKAGGFC